MPPSEPTTPVSSDELHRAYQSLAAGTANYYYALKATALPEPLIWQLVRDRSMLIEMRASWPSAPPTIALSLATPERP